MVQRTIERRGHMKSYLWNVYYENADTDEEKKYIGTIEATYEGQALHNVSQFYEHPSYDLIVKRSDLDTGTTKEG